MVIALLASFTPLLEEGGCQHNPSFLRDFLRVGLPLRPAKSLKGLCRMPTLCGVSYGQMAKVELRVLYSRTSENPLQANFAECTFHARGELGQFAASSRRRVSRLARAMP